MSKILKKTLIFSIIFVLLLSVGTIIFYWYNNSNIAKVVLTKPSIKQTNEYIFTNGTIIEQDKKDININIPLIPKKVYVNIGDEIKSGDIIADIDIEATQTTLIKYIGVLTSLPSKYTDAISSLDIDLNKYLKLIPEKITSPTSGIVTSLSLLPGFLSMSNSSVATISNPDKLIAKFSVPESSIESVKEQDTVVFKATATDSIKHTAKVILISPVANQTLNGTTSATTVEVYATITSDVSKLKPGYSIFGAINKVSNHNTLTIPYESINQDEQNNEYCYVYKDFKAVKQTIKTGKEFENHVEVLSGVDENMLIIENIKDIKTDNSYVFIKE